MTERQKKFADAYILDGDPVKAFTEAGYREKPAASAARRLLDTPSVKAYIEEHASCARSREVADASEILRYLTTVLRGEHSSDRERLRAAELLGKRHGLFQEETDERTAAVIIVDDLHG